MSEWSDVLMRGGWMVTGHQSGEYITRHFLDTPSDICLCKNGIEDTHHFLLKCEFYSNHRTKMITKVTNILSENDLSHLDKTVQLYLYGDSSLSFTENKEILSATIEYIMNTNRFT